MTVSANTLLDLHDLVPGSRICLNMSWQHFQVCGLLWSGLHKCILEIDACSQRNKLRPLVVADCLVTKVTTGDTGTASLHG